MTTNKLLAAYFPHAASGKHNCGLKGFKMRVLSPPTSLLEDADRFHRNPQVRELFGVFANAGKSSDQYQDGLRRYLSAAIRADMRVGGSLPIPADASDPDASRFAACGWLQAAFGSMLCPHGTTEYRNALARYRAAGQRLAERGISA